MTASDSWVWSQDVGQSPSCTYPPLESASEMCAGDPTSVVIQGTGQPQCISSSLHHCKFNMRDFVQLDADLSMIDCGGTWAAPLWMTPDYWEGGGSAGEIDMLENCPSSALYSNFAGGGNPKRWEISNPNSFQGHMTMWKQDDGDGIMSIRVKTCTSKEATEGSGSCFEEDAAYYRDIYGQNGCKDGNCMYTMVSDIWNGWAGDGGFSECTNGQPQWGNQCKFSVSNIRIKGVPFTGKCTALSGWPVPAGVPVSISANDAHLCVDLEENVEARHTPVQLWSCDKDHPNAAQSWVFRDGQIIHQSASGEGFCLDIPDNKRINGASLQLYTCNGSPQQQFMHQDGAIKTLDGSKCLDLRTEDMRTLQLWDCIPGAAAQQWLVTEVSTTSAILV